MSNLNQLYAALWWFFLTSRHLSFKLEILAVGIPARTLCNFDAH